MPTYAELNAEACWRAQFTPPALNSLAVSLRTRYGRDGNSISSPGDNRHLSGAHRSRRWIRESRYCTNRTYTVTYADDLAGDENWYAAIDIGLATQAELLEMCKRLDAAVRAGLLEGIAAWYGNIDGDQRVDGYDNILDRLASSDSSHLTHLHITFKRRYANDAALMARVLAALTGDDGMTDAIELGQAIAGGSRTDGWLKPDNPLYALRFQNFATVLTEVRALHAKVDASTAAAAQAIAALATALQSGGSSVETAPILAAIREVGSDVEQLHADNAALRAENDALRAQIAALPGGVVSTLVAELTD